MGIAGYLPMVGKEKELDILTFRMVQPESYLFI
jgi:hypothetical protein